MGLAITGLLAKQPSVIFENVDFSQRLISPPSVTVELAEAIAVAFVLGSISLILNGLASANEVIGLRTYGLSEDINDILEGEEVQTEYSYLTERLDRYKERIEDNSELVGFMDFVLGIGKVTLLFSIFIAVSTIAAALTGPINVFLFTGVLVCILIGVVWMDRKLPSGYSDI